jgi:hypothetical protein
MKTFITAAFILLSGIKVNAQTFKTYADTANYLISRIENNKNYYIGKPFSVLYDSLKIKPVYVIPSFGNTNPNDKQNFARDLRFEFNYEQDFSKAHSIVIKWNTPPPYNSIHPLLFPGINQPVNISAVVNLYKSLIVKDIILKDYAQDDKPEKEKDPDKSSGIPGTKSISPPVIKSSGN